MRCAKNPRTRVDGRKGFDKMKDRGGFMKSRSLFALIFLFAGFAAAYPKVRYSVQQASSVCTGEVQPDGRIKYLGHCTPNKAPKNLAREIQTPAKVPPTKKAKNEVQEPLVIERR
jgi:hypothetical protein